MKILIIHNDFITQSELIESLSSCKCLSGAEFVRSRDLIWAQTELNECDMAFVKLREKKTTDISTTPCKE